MVGLDEETGFSGSKLFCEKLNSGCVSETICFKAGFFFGCFMGESSIF
jgi:hypothetical protein